MPSIRDARILIMATDGFEQSELAVPLDKLRAAGAQVKVASPKGPNIRGWAETDWGDSVPVDLTIKDASVDDFDALVLPGGQINPDKLRTDDDAIDLILDFLDIGKPVAAICHAPWLLIEADAVDGRRVTSWASIKTDVENAGGEWVDEEVVVDDGVITSRSPTDLDAFVAKIISEVEASGSDEAVRTRA